MITLVANQTNPDFLFVVRNFRRWWSHLNPRLSREDVANATKLGGDNGDDGDMWYVKGVVLGQYARRAWPSASLRPFGGFVMLVVMLRWVVILPQVVDFMWRQPTPDIWTWEEMLDYQKGCRPSTRSFCESMMCYHLIRVRVSLSERPPWLWPTFVSDRPRDRDHGLFNRLCTTTVTCYIYLVALVSVPRHRNLAI